MIMHFFIVPVTDLFSAIRMRQEHVLYFWISKPHIFTFYLQNMYIEHLQLCAENYLFTRARFEKHLVSVLKTHITQLLTQLLFWAILGSSQPLILKEASIFSWLPPVPCSSHCKLPLRCIILYTLQSHTLHHKVIYSSLLTHPAHVPVSSSPHFLSHCTNPGLHSEPAKPSTLWSHLEGQSTAGAQALEWVKEQAGDTGC